MENFAPRQWHTSKVLGRNEWLPKHTKINEADLHKLKEIVNRQPDLYLDELALFFGITTGKYEEKE